MVPRRQNQLRLADLLLDLRSNLYQKFLWQLCFSSLLHRNVYDYIIRALFTLFIFIFLLWSFLINDVSKFFPIKLISWWVPIFFLETISANVCFVSLLFAKLSSILCSKLSTCFCNYFSWISSDFSSFNFLMALKSDSSFSFCFSMMFCHPGTSLYNFSIIFSSCDINSISSSDGIRTH